MIEKAVRKDKIKNKSKVIKELIKNPVLTEREVAKKTWLSNWGVHNHIKEIEQNWAESQIMDRILEMDDKIMELANEITLTKIIKEAKKDDDWKIDVEALSLQDIKTIWDLANNSTKRKAIFGDKWEWKVNDNITIQIYKK